MSFEDDAPPPRLQRQMGNKACELDGIADSLLGIEKDDLAAQVRPVPAGLGELADADDCGDLQTPFVLAPSSRRNRREADSAIARFA